MSVTTLRDGVQVVDLGQNINGHVRLATLGPTGTELTLTHGEALGPDGDVTMDHLVPNLPFLPDLTAGQVDSVVSAGVDGDVFEPRFTTHGFRYVRIEGDLPPVSPDDVTGVVVHTDLEERGGFVCSDDRLNRLHDAAVWSFRGNACDVPTDCPTRERAGWTGDWQLYVPTASYLYDVAGFSLKWLRDLAAMQWEDGTLNNMAPIPVAERTGFLEQVNGSAGWGDAVVLVPWELYREYGDAAVLAELWPAMVGWLDRMERMATNDRHPDRIARHPEPRPHDSYLWDTGFHWGEWLEPDGNPVATSQAFITADKAVVATAFYAWSTRHAAEIARVLDDKADRRPVRRAVAGPSPTRGAPSSSTPTVTCSRTPRPTWSGRWPSVCFPTTCTSWRPTTWPRWSATSACTSAPGSSRPPTCCRCSPSTATWTSRTSC